MPFRLRTKWTGSPGADEEAHLGHFYDSPRHRMQVDFFGYCKDLMKEIERGSKRAKVSA